MARGKNVRKEWYVEREKERQQQTREVFDDGNVGEISFVDPKEYAREQIYEEYLLTWALYRDDGTDFKQVEAYREAIREGPEVAQSSVSRKLSTLEKRVLTTEIPGLEETPIYEECEKFSQYPRALLESQRDMIAEFILMRHALPRLIDAAIENPEWAAERFPELAEYHSE